MSFTFAIIGGGLTGTAMLQLFVEKVRQEIDLNLLNPSEIKIQIFEKQDIFGPGFPHCDRNVMPFYITNMCAKDMGILVGHPEDFQDWANINHDRLKERYQWIDDTSFSYEGCNHYPRAIRANTLKKDFKRPIKKHKRWVLGWNFFRDLRLSI